MSGDHFLIALFKSFWLHVAIGAALIVSVNFSPTPKPEPKVIQVQPIKSVAVDQQKLNEQIDKIKNRKAQQKAAEEKRVRDLEERANKAQRNRNDAEKKIKDLNKKTRQSQQEKRKADAAAKKAKEKQKREQAKATKAAADAKKKLDEKKRADKAAADAKKKRIAEEKKAQAAENARKEKARKDEQERQRKAKEARERRQAELELQRQMASEQAARDTAYQQKVLSEVEKYTALIISRVEQSIIKDDAMKGKKCKVEINLAESGFVYKVNVLGGDPLTCQATRTGILKAGNLPVSKEPAVFEKLKVITINYIPEF